ncbi:FKBP-type peptidyl-prolyl cis-trans isomerase [Ancylomarina longa]|uniref:Peptidyl-prolyl cis-trans isomerase n=1 Tax=Ancylomarina longa TaxID=2487017 RepID=A0A434AFB7_9BACT|nr:FKBP-type peptidyl-prolyl cis-trans isomerase [Ancylomarina longa]RUT73073.1 FKBP-type peptidyl-prolyl cis-trans isomerase [Ancylomarina longa]
MKYTEEQDKVSYCLGLSIASNLITSGVKTINVEPFTEALDAAFNGKMPELSPEEANKILQEYFTKVQEEQAGKAIETGKKFMEENAKKENVVSLASGLQYEVVAEGNGESPKGTDSVKCHYHGTLIDGTVFDSSVNRGEPAVFPVNGVIKGWIEALQLMTVGAKWKLYVPSDLAYGAQGAGNLIGPHTALIFEVELLEIV